MLEYAFLVGKEGVTVRIERFRIALLSIAALLAVCLLLALADPFAVERRSEKHAEKRVEALTQAAAARKSLQLALGLQPDNFHDLVGVQRELPEYVTALYIDSDFLLHVQLFEPTQEQEQVVREALKGWSKIVVYEVSPESPAQRTLRQEAVAAALAEAGFRVRTAHYNVNSGRIQVALEDLDHLSLAAAWRKTQQTYPFDGDCPEIRFYAKETDSGIWRMTTDFSCDYEKLDAALQARSVLNDWIEAQGGSRALSWYMGYYLGNDAAVHIVLKEEAPDDRVADLREALEGWSFAVTLEQGDYPKEAREAWLDDLCLQLQQMGIPVASWGIGEKGQPASIGLGNSRDAELILSLFGEDSPYPFRTPDFPLLLY